MKNKIWIALTTITIGFLIFDKCNSERKIENQAEQLLNYTDSVTILKGGISKNTALSLENDMLKVVLNKEKLSNEKLRGQLKLYSDVTSFTKVRQEVVIHDTIEVGFDNPIEFKFTRAIEIDSPFFNMQADVSESRFRLLSLKIPNEQSIVVGKFKRTGLFKKKEAAITITNSNKYVNITGIQNYSVKEEKKIWDRPVLWGVIGFVGGVMLAK